MRRTTYIASIAALAALALSGCGGPQGYVPHPDRVDRTVTSAEGDIGVAVEGHNDFAFRLHASIAADAENENVVHSPFSVTTVFGMVLAGADGSSRTELMDTLGVPVDEDAWHGAMGALTRDLAGDLKRAYTLHLANRLFGQIGYPFQEPFLQTCATDYGTPLEAWDFQADAEGGRERVNAWVAEQTQDRIQDLLPPGSVTSDSRLVLANAIYFLADWAVAFDPDNTESAPFQTLDGGSVDVPMMTMDVEEIEEHSIRGAVRDNIRVVKLPYEEHEVSMVLLTPHNEAALPTFEAELTGAQYASLTADLPVLSQGVVGLPRVEITRDIDLIPHLRGLGITEVFSTQADFSRLADVDEALFITDAFHEAYVRIDEQGTEAAAATAAVVGRVSASEPLIADRPFLFIIQDDLTGAVLFAGRVVDPR